ncbi:MAG: ferrous iron transport protein B, partial [Planctomycetota bacterium]
MQPVGPEHPAASAKSYAMVALAGNPNSGKTTLFNALTGYRQRVGNYPGVTVERKLGRLRHGQDPVVEIIDLPGAYSLAARSADEMVVCDVLFGHQPGLPPIDLIVAVVDASNLQRHLFLTTQLIEVGVPVVIALTMMDVARAAGVEIDADALSRRLGVPVACVTATKGLGLNELKHQIVATLDAGAPRHHPEMPQPVLREVDGLQESLQARAAHSANGLPHARFELLQAFLDRDGYTEKRLARTCGSFVRDELHQRRQRVIQDGVPLASIEGQVRYEWIDAVLDGTVRESAPRVRTRSDAVDRLMTHRFCGGLIFLAMVGVVFQAIYSWAQPLMDLTEGLFAGLGAWVASVMPAGALRSLITDGIITGVGSVLVFLPQILILFLFIAILEDCGYLARGAFLMDRWLRLFGLTGKSFIPLLSSFACAIPGIMASRTIENRSDRMLTILVAPLMSCSARLPVYVLLIGAFVPATAIAGGLIGVQGLVLLAMYLLGLVVAVPVALLAKRFFFRGESHPFLIELPSYRRPSAKNVLFRMYESGREFVVRAGTVIFAVSIVVWALGYYPRSASVAAEYDAKRADARASLAGPGLEDALTAIDRSEAGTYLRQSFLGRAGRTIEPAVAPLGWDWRIGTAAVASFPAREVVIATLGTIYNLGEEQAEESSHLRAALQAATWPDGRKVFSLPVALSIMVFFALCCQCGSTLAVMRKETNSWRWP